MKDKTTLKIDFGKHVTHGVRVLSGRDKGEELRAHYRLDACDASPSEGHVEVLIPQFLTALTPSLLLGLFGPSVRNLTPPIFRQRYEFVGPNARETEEELIEDAMKEAAVGATSDFF